MKTLHKLWISALAIGLVVIVVVMHFTTQSNKPDDGRSAATEQFSEQTSSVARAGSESLTYGFAISSNITGLPSLARLDQLRKIRSTGVTEVRFDMDWNTIQPKTKTSYVWTQYDSLLKDIAAAHLNMIITLNRTPDWAGSANCKGLIECPPADVTTFSTFAAKASARYKNYPVSAWEIWNEPNIENFWKPLPSPDHYAELLKASYKSIKAANSSAVVIVGGLEGKANDGNPKYVDGRTFLSRLYDDGAGDYFDGVAFHPYTHLRLPITASSYNGWPKMFQTATSIQSIMVSHGDQQKQLWITEFGVPTYGVGSGVDDLNNSSQLASGDHVSQQNQALIIAAALKDAQSHSQIRSLDIYTYADSPSLQLTNGYGLLDSSGKPKIAYSSFINALK